MLWFAWKFVPLWYQQQRWPLNEEPIVCCDLLENSYLCGISNNYCPDISASKAVVICLKIRTFVVSATTCNERLVFHLRCDLLENSYLCGISNNNPLPVPPRDPVVICLKIRTFVVSATTFNFHTNTKVQLWFAWKFVPLWYQQQHFAAVGNARLSCDLLENSYLCGISNNC